ncbi:MAG TPA: crotonase/enoyl-CoA hydratase family protein [Candidatus Binatia bacterium]|nr:crotonase/enoyl-CoA hydratase family protein [Candidatus Binatia bacterium]
MRIAEGIAWIVIDDGKVNAMSVDMMDDVQTALTEAERAGAVTVLAGRPGIFSAGFDLGTFRLGGDAPRRMVLAGARLVERLLAFSRPVVSACTGHAYPMGAFLMLASDVRIGALGPWRIGMNETAIGLTVPLFAIEIARHRLTAPGFARITTAAMFDPEEAVAFGYLDRAVAAEDVETVARREAERLRNLDGAAYVATKARVNERALGAVRAAIAAELVGAPDQDREGDAGTAISPTVASTARA